MYIPSSRKIISSYDVVFDESFSSELAYTPRPYSEAMDMRLSVTYTPYAASSNCVNMTILPVFSFEDIK